MQQFKVRKTTEFLTKAEETMDAVNKAKEYLNKTLADYPELESSLQDYKTQIRKADALGRRIYERAQQAVEYITVQFDETIVNTAMELFEELRKMDEQLQRRSN